MTDFADQFGEWSVLGIATPITTKWILFPGNAANSEVFRLTFDTNWAQWEQEAKSRFKSYGLIQEEYRPIGIGSADQITTQTRQRIVPQNKQLLIKIDPLSFDYKTEIQRQLKIKRFYWSRQNWELTQPALDIPWSIQIEAMEPNH
jgi:hypothetical protein